MAEKKKVARRRPKEESPEQPANKLEVQDERAGLVRAGVAILGKDDITQMKVWRTFDGEENDYMPLSPEQPLVFPVRKLPPGSRVELYIPVQKDEPKPVSRVRIRHKG